MLWKLVLLIGLFWIGKKLILVWNLFFKVCPTFGDNGSVGYGGGENIVWLSSVGWSLPVVFRDTVRTTWWLGSNELKWITFSGLVGSNNTYQVPLLTPTGDPKIHIDALSLFVQFLRYQETKQLFKESKNKSAEKRWELLWESISAQTLQLF